MEKEAATSGVPVVPVPHPTMQLMYQATCISVKKGNVTEGGCGPQGDPRGTEAEAQADWQGHLDNVQNPLQHEGIVLNYIAPIPSTPAGTE